MLPTTCMEGSALCADSEGVWTGGRHVSQGEPSLSSSGQPCSCSRTESCTVPSGSPKVTDDLIHTKEAGYTYVCMNTCVCARTQAHTRQKSPALDCPQPKLLPELCGRALSYASLTMCPPSLACTVTGAQQRVSFTLTTALCPTLTVFLSGRHRAAALATWTSSRLLRHVTLWL